MKNHWLTRQYAIKTIVEDLNNRGWTCNPIVTFSNGAISKLTLDVSKTGFPLLTYICDRYTPEKEMWCYARAEEESILAEQHQL